MHPALKMLEINTITRFLLVGTSFIVWASSFNPLLGHSRSRSRCWAGNRRSHHAKLSGCTVQGEVDGLEIEGRHGWWFVLLHPTHTLQNGLLWSESPSGKCAKLHTVAASDNSDHVPQSLFTYAGNYVHMLESKRLNVITTTCAQDTADLMQTSTEWDWLTIETVCAATFNLPITCSITVLLWPLHAVSPTPPTKT